MDNKPKKTNSKLPNSQSDAQIVTKIVLRKATERVFPILGDVLSASADIKDALAQRDFSLEVVTLLNNLVNKTDNMQNKLNQLNDTQKYIFANCLYSSCVAYDETISCQKKNYFKNLLKSILENPDNLDLNLQDMYLTLIQSLPTYSLLFLNSMYKKFQTNTVPVESDMSRSNWKKFVSSWKKCFLGDIQLANSLETKVILGPLVLKGLVNKSTLPTGPGIGRYTIPSMSELYQVTELGKNFLEYFFGKDL